MGHVWQGTLRLACDFSVRTMGAGGRPVPVLAIEVMLFLYAGESGSSIAGGNPAAALAGGVASTIVHPRDVARRRAWKRVMVLCCLEEHFD